MNKNLLSGLHQRAETKRVVVDETSFAYRTFGKSDGIPLVFFQHFTGTMDNWDPAVTNGLSKDFLVVLFDNKGIGGSHGKTPVTIEAMAVDAVMFLRALGFKKVNVLGFSMGGFIAQQIMLIEPHLINKILLVGTAPKGGQGIAGIVNLLTESAAMKPDEQKMYMFYESTATSMSLGAKSLERMNERKIDRDPETNLTAIEAQLKSILSWAKPDQTYLARLQQIGIPTLIVNGSNDIVVPTVNSYVMFQNFPNARLSLYPDSGHGSIFQYPELFLWEAIPFLKCD